MKNNKLKREEKKYIKNKKHESALDSIILDYFQQNIIKSNNSFKQFVGFFEKRIILSALEITNGNQKTACALLGINSTTLNEKIKKIGILKTDYHFNILNIVEMKLKQIENK